MSDATLDVPEDGPMAKRPRVAHSGQTPGYGEAPPYGYAAPYDHRGRTEQQHLVQQWDYGALPLSQPTNDPAFPSATSGSPVAVTAPTSASPAPQPGPACADGSHARSDDSAAASAAPEHDCIGASTAFYHQSDPAAVDRMSTYARQQLAHAAEARLQDHEHVQQHAPRGSFPNAFFTPYPGVYAHPPSMYSPTSAYLPYAGSGPGTKPPHQLHGQYSEFSNLGTGPSAELSERPSADGKMQDGVWKGPRYGQPLPHNYTGRAASSYELEIVKHACRQKFAHQVAQSALQHHVEQRRAHSAALSTPSGAWAPATTPAMVPPAGLHPHTEAQLQHAVTFGGKPTLPYDPAERGARPPTALLPAYTHWAGEPNRSRLTWTSTTAPSDGVQSSAIADQRDRSLQFTLSNPPPPPPEDEGAEVLPVPLQNDAMKTSKAYKSPDGQVKVVTTDPDTGALISIKPIHSKQSAEVKAKLSTNKKVYMCPFCGHIFSCSSNLSRHKRVHTGDKPYKCQHCQCAFSNSSNRRKHEQKCDQTKGGSKKVLPPQPGEGNVDIKPEKLVMQAIGLSDAYNGANHTGELAAHNKAIRAMQATGFNSPGQHPAPTAATPAPGATPATLRPIFGGVVATATRRFGDGPASFAAESVPVPDKVRDATSGRVSVAAMPLPASAWPTCRTLPYVRPPRDAVYVCDAMTQTDPFPDAGIAGQTRPEEAAAAAAAATAREKISV